MYVASNTVLYMVCMYVCMHACMYVCMCLCLCMYVCMYIYMYVYIYMCVCVCLYAFISNPGPDRCDRAGSPAAIGWIYRPCEDPWLHTKPCREFPSQVEAPFARILGILAMIDDDETDWKVLTIALDDDKAPILCLCCGKSFSLTVRGYISLGSQNSKV